jgi:hypothetical protein
MAVDRISVFHCCPGSGAATLHQAIPGRAAIALAVLGNGSASHGASYPVRGTNDIDHRGAPGAAPTRGHVAGPSGLGSSAMILLGRCRPWSREAAVGSHVLAHRLTGKRASISSVPLGQPQIRELVRAATLLGEHRMHVKVFAAFKPLGTDGTMTPLPVGELSRAIRQGSGAAPPLANFLSVVWHS